MTQCRTGPEICVYESHRIQILSIVELKNANYYIRYISGDKINPSLFKSFTSKRYCVNGGCHNFNAFGKCIKCGLLIFELGTYQINAFGRCDRCGISACALGCHKYISRRCVRCGKNM